MPDIIPFNFSKRVDEKLGLKPERLTKARKAKRLTQQGLADKLDLTRQSISAFELGIRHPDGATLFKIANVLEQPISYFGNTMPDGFGIISTCFFRAFGPDTKLRNEQCKVLGEWISSITNYFSKKVNFPSLHLPNFSSNSITNFYTDTDIDDIATKVRREWGLGDGPISNLVALLESKGIFIAQLPIFDDDQVNAFSFWSGPIPFIILGGDQKSATRRRFDVAHELGHLILHHGIDYSELENKEILNRIESEANKFASAFLLPFNTFPNEVLSTRLDSFVELKRRWKTSISAQIYRCKTLGIFSELQFLNLYKQLSARKWRTKEPLDDEIPFENPSLLRKAIELLINNHIIQKHEIINQINLDSSLIEKICRLPTNWLASFSVSKESPVLNNFKSPIQSKKESIITHASSHRWENIEAQISEQINQELPLLGHMFQISIHPLKYDEVLFNDSKTLHNKLIDSIDIHRGWSFPCPAFEIKKKNPSNLIKHKTDRLFLNGNLESAFCLDLSGFIIYREQLSVAYDSATPGKPLLILWPFLTLYRAIKFLCNLFDFIPDDEIFIIKLKITDTYKRLLASEIIQSFNHISSFYGASEITAPKIQICLNLTKGEISKNPLDSLFEITKQIINFTDAKILDSELKSELKKIANSA